MSNLPLCVMKGRAGTQVSTEFSTELSTELSMELSAAPSRQLGWGWYPVRESQPTVAIPPSTGIIAPVRYAPARDARKTAVPAMSSARPMRFKGALAAI